MPDHIQSRADDQHPGKGKSNFGVSSIVIIAVVAAVIAAILLLT